MNFHHLIEGPLKLVRRGLFIAWWESTGLILKTMSRVHDLGWKLRYKVATGIIDFGKPKEEEESA